MSEPTQHDETESVVLDTQPLIVWSDGEDGADTIEKYLSGCYHRDIDLQMSQVNLSEYHYNTERKTGSRERAREETQRLLDFGLEPVGTDEVWQRAAEVREDYTPDFPLADAYALATADVLELPLLVGVDTHWNEPMSDGYDIRRI